MRYAPQSPSFDARMRAAGQAQLAAAVKTPGLLPALMRRRHELLPRFVAYYTQLRALPRRVRWALQRQWRLPLAGIALMLALGQQPVQAATISVGGSCTLCGCIPFSLSFLCGFCRFSAQSEARLPRFELDK